MPCCRGFAGEIGSKSPLASRYGWMVSDYREDLTPKKSGPEGGLVSDDVVQGMHMGDEGIAEKDRAYQACAELRFAEGLRRRSNEVRAEAAVQEAVATSWLEGMRVNADAVRATAMGLVPRNRAVVSADPSAADLSGRTGLGSRADDLDLPLAGAMGAWRAMWRVQDLLPDLNARPAPGAPPMSAPRTPMLGLLASLNKDACSFLVAAGALDPSVVALPQRTDVVHEVARLAAPGGRGAEQGDAIDRAGTMLRLLVTEPVFAAANVTTALAAVKWFLATSGVEPTGVSVLSRWGVEAGPMFPSRLREDPTGVAAQSLIRGCAEGQGIVRAVQAGKLPG